MSIETVSYPSYQEDNSHLADILRQLDFSPCENVMPWPKDTLHFHWFNNNDFLSFDGVEANIYKVSKDDSPEDVKCLWVLHSRTRESASIADRQKQNELVRTIRSKLGGYFVNDRYGKNRYNPKEVDLHGPIGRGVYLTYELIKQDLRAIIVALPEPWNKKQPENKLDEIAVLYDPMKVIYNALIPGAIAIFENFFSSVFKILLKYDKKLKEKIEKHNIKVELTDAFAISISHKSIEEVICSWYSFQNLDSLSKAFKEWHNIDFWKIVNRRKKIGEQLPQISKMLSLLIQYRHGIIHGFQIDRSITKDKLKSFYELIDIILEEFVKEIERIYRIQILQLCA